MADLIRRQDALDDAFALEYAFCHHEAVKLYYERLKGALERIPAVDAVEVIRCEKCRHSEMIDAVRYCFKWGRNTENDGYCHEGY